MNDIDALQVLVIRYLNFYLIVSLIVAGSNTIMGAYFTQFRRILLHRQVTRLEQGQVAIQSTSMNISLSLEVMHITFSHAIYQNCAGKSLY